MQHRKTRQEARAERLASLTSLEPGMHELLERVLRETSRKVVEADDVLDAAVAMSTDFPQQGSLQALQGSPTNGDLGLLRRMLFRVADVN